MNAPIPQTAPVNSTPFKVAISRPESETPVGRAFLHARPKSIHVALDTMPIMPKDARLVIFSGDQGERFSEDAAACLTAFEVVEHTTENGKKTTNWKRIGYAFLGAGGDTYDLSLDAVPASGKIILAAPQARGEGHEEEAQ